MFRPFTQLREPYAFIRQFTPNWFTLNMGTGILCLVLITFPFPFSGQRAIALGLWWLDVLLFGINTVLFLARILCFRHTIVPMLQHPVQSMFLGAIPMGLVPIINGLVLLGGAPWYGLAYALWWVDVILALAVALLVPYYMCTQQTHEIEQMTAVWLLPIVAPEVTASSAGVLALHLPAAQAQLVLALGYVLWAISLPLAFIIITLLFLRLVVHKLPSADMAASCWLPLGPIGTGALGLILLGQAAPTVFNDSALYSVALLARDLGLLGGLLLWGIGLWWLGAAVLFTRRYLHQPLPFNMGWWGFTFPLGVYTLATLRLGQLTHFLPFSVFGALLSLALGLVWLIVVQRTLKGIWHGNLFHAPCLNK